MWVMAEMVRRRKPDRRLSVATARNILAASQALQMQEQMQAASMRDLQTIQKRLARITLECKLGIIAREYIRSYRLSKRALKSFSIDVGAGR